MIDDNCVKVYSWNDRRVIKVESEIKQTFDDLLNEYHFTKAIELLFDNHMGFCVILYKSAEYGWLRFLRERGVIELAFGPVGRDANWEVGPWYDFTIVIDYFTYGKDCFKYEHVASHVQLSRIAGKLASYSDRIFNLMKSDTYLEYRAELENACEKFRANQWANLGAT